MRWLVLARKATRRSLKRHQDHPNGGSNSGCGSHAWKQVGWPKSMMLPSLFYDHQYATSTTVNGIELRCLKNDNDHKKVDLDITSREIIKPASPTPQHLRTFNLSIIDQLFLDLYTPSILFFSNDSKTSATVVGKQLKKSLSEILTRFFPFAGEIKDDLHIVCNDKGVTFMEARVNQSLKEFLRYPDDDNVRELVPKSPRTGEPSVGNYIIGVQVNIFSCGGIGLSTSLSHKIFDGHTIFMFLKAWAAATRGSEKVFPSFVASQLFPNNPNFNYSWPSKFTNTKSVTTKRFRFDPNAIATLKDQAVVGTSKRGPTRTEATTAVIWKAAAKASSAIRPFGPQSPHALLSIVNLRARAFPPFPYESIGNLIHVSRGICFPESQPDFPKLIGEIRESIAKINSEHIDSLFKGEKGNSAYYDILRSFDDLMDITEEGDRCLSVSSLLNNGIYNIDFGWGKPIWFYVMNAGFRRIIYMNDTLNGGVEAAVTLTSSEMKIFESDTELLSYATVNPSPLQLLDN